MGEGVRVAVLVGVRVWVGAEVDVAAWVVAGFFVAVGVKMTGEEVAVCTGGKVPEPPCVAKGPTNVADGSVSEVGACSEAIPCPGV